MTTTTATITEDRAGMVSAADAKLAPMVSHQADIAGQIDAAHAELDALTHAHSQREHVLNEARATAERLEAEHSQAVQYAAIANETPNQRRAIEAASGAKKRMLAAQKDVARLQSDAVEADRVASARQEELLAVLDCLTGDYARTDASLQQLQAARGQAHRELGEHKHAAILDEYHALEARLVDAQRQMVDAQVEQHDFHAMALEALSEWPEHQADIARLPEVENATSRLIDVTLLYLETVLNDWTGLRAVPDEVMPRKGIGFLNLLLVPPELVLQCGRDQVQLTEHTNLLRQTRDNHLAWLRQQRQERTQ